MLIAALMTINILHTAARAACDTRYVFCECFLLQLVIWKCDDWECVVRGVSSVILNVARAMVLACRSALSACIYARTRNVCPTVLRIISMLLKLTPVVRVVHTAIAALGRQLLTASPVDTSNLSITQRSMAQTPLRLYSDDFAMHASLCWFSALVLQLLLL